MTNPNEQILDAIDIIVDQKIKNLKFDKTVKGVVEETYNEENGLKENYYKINISGVTHILKYTKGTLKKHSGVYVLIPVNDIKKMFILCPC